MKIPQRPAVRREAGIAVNIAKLPELLGAAKTS
jgi:hypothetical protein